MRFKLASSNLVLVTALAACVATATAGTERAAGDPGVTARSILLGGTAPLTGEAPPSASVVRGAEAYFDYVNARGGVNGRTITYKVVDDGNDLAVNAAVTRRLVEEDKVFAVFGSVGTPQSLAIRSYLNAVKVPQLFVASGATALGRDAAAYPYTIGFEPTYEAEGWVYGRYLARTAPTPAIAVLFEDGLLGTELFGGLKLGLQRSRAKVVAARSVKAAAPDLTAQVVRLKASGADTLVIFATPALALQAFAAAGGLGWRPRRVIVGSAAAGSISAAPAELDAHGKIAEGAISITYVKDPTDPHWRADAGMNLYRRIMGRYAPDANADDPSYVQGMAVAWAAAEAVRRAGRDLTRSTLSKALERYTVAGDPFLLPGIALKTSRADRFPIEQVMLQRWGRGGWRPFGGLWAYRAP